MDMCRRMSAEGVGSYRNHCITWPQPMNTFAHCLNYATAFSAKSRCSALNVRHLTQRRQNIAKIKARREDLNLNFTGFRWPR